MDLWRSQITKQDKLDDISDVCVMSDMIRFEDMDKDGRLGLNEFYAAFSKLYSKYGPLLQSTFENNMQKLPIKEFYLPAPWETVMVPVRSSLDFHSLLTIKQAKKIFQKIFYWTSHCISFNIERKVD